MLEQIGLYYPYVRIRDERWLKTAALYMPRLARLVPDGYRVTDSPTLRALRDELDFVVPVDPALSAQRLAPVFLDLLHHHGPALRRWYQVTDDIQNPPHQSRPHQPWSLRANVPWQRADGDRTLAELHRGEVTDSLREALLDSGLAVQTLPSWITMDAALAWVYKRALVEETAHAGRFSPATDQLVAHLASGGQDTDGIASVLLDGFDTAPSDGDTDAVGLLALRIVAPDDLTDVPVQKIIRIRRRNQDLFDRFSAEVTRTVTELTEEIADVTLPESRKLLIATTVDQRFAQPLDELRRAMKGLRVDTAFSAASLKFELPAAAGAGALGVLGNQPVLGAAVGAAFALGTLTRLASGQRSALLRESPTAYLLSVERGLEPATLLHRLTHRA
ncbi:DUF6236 family protein [Streptomyces sp. NPDC048290]|uniref:DUF6236 family protein n=1 Tax=Streptomyces sp. NPDC048290 TaxID=3155811 RepID=UPI0034274DCB